MTADVRSHSERAFRALLALFPDEFRAQFGDDMAELFRDQHAAARARAGVGGVGALWRRTLPRLAMAIVAEHRDVRRDASSPRPRDSMLETIASDLRFALRMLRKSPMFAAVAVLCMSIGCGAVTTIFSAMNALVLRPLPGAFDPGRLVRIERMQTASNNRTSISFDFYEQLRTRAHSLDALGAWSKVSLTIGRRGESGAAIYGNFVSGNFFGALGVRPLLGRFFVREEDATEGTHPVIVVSEGLWRSRLGGDTAAVGRPITVNGLRFTLVGVTPTAFQGLDAPIKTDAWIPLRMRRALQPRAAELRDPGTSWLRTFGRVKSGTTLAAAQSELTALTVNYARENREPEWAHRFSEMRLSMLTGLPTDASSALTGFLGLLLGAAVLVMLISSVNVAAMLSARAIARRREMAVRAALGAGRGRLVRQLLTEILLIFAMGAIGGTLMAILATNALEQLPIPGELAFALELSPDGRVLAFALTLSLLTGIIFGLAPARRGARADIAQQLRDGSAASSARRTFVGSSLVIGQLALSLLLLVGAGLFVRALQRGTHIDVGFDATDVAAAPFNAESWGYDEAKGRTFYRTLSERIASIDGVQAVSYATVLPLALHSANDNMKIQGAGSRADAETMVSYLQIDGDYFASLRVPLVAGRAITSRDDEHAPLAAVVNETFAKQTWPGMSVLGRTFEFRGQRVTIVGVARDVKYASLTEATPKVAYLSLSQFWDPKRSLIVRSRLDAPTLTRQLQRAVRDADAELPQPVAVPLRESMGLGLLPQRVAALVTAILGSVGLVLAAIGLYGIVAYSVSRRTREIGIRLALGAHAADVLRMVVREGMQLTAIGVAVGLALAWAATRLMSSFLFGVSPLDAATFALMSAVFALVALVASWLPARRASHADPTVVLRGE